MNKSLSLSIALLLMASGWVGAFLLAANPVVNQGYWVLPALVIGAGIGLCLRSVSGRKTALLLTVTAAIGLSSFNTLFPESRINTGAIRRLFSGNYSSSQPHLLQVPDRLQVPPFDQPLALVSPLSLDLSLFARFATGVTDFCFSPQGDLYASLPALGAVYRQQPGAGVAPAKISLFLQKLDTPSGLLCTDNRLLVAERSQVRAFSYVDKSDSVLMRMPSIEAGHLDHQLLNSPQGLLVSVGSRCDACQEADSLRATVQLLASQGRLQPFATGLRHLGGLAFDSATNILWASERSRLYPAPGAADELNRLRMNKDYGWPDCEGKNVQQKQRCEDFAAPALLLRHRANPMGLMTTGTIDFPQVYRHSLLLVLQGEAENRIVPAVVRVPLVEGQAGAPVPFLGGWDGRSMRPAAIHPGPDGAVYIADDMNGAIYRAAWKRGE